MYILHDASEHGLRKVIGINDDSAAFGQCEVGARLGGWHAVPAVWTNGA